MQVLAEVRPRIAREEGRRDNRAADGRGRNSSGFMLDVDTLPARLSGEIR